MMINDPPKDHKNTSKPTDNLCARFQVLEYTSKKVHKKAVQPNPKPAPNEAINTPHKLNRRLLFINHRKKERIKKPKVNIANILTIFIIPVI